MELILRFEEAKHKLLLAVRPLYELITAGFRRDAEYQAGEVTTLESALSGLRRYLVVIGVFSAFVNILMLTSSLYMLQIYDRVLASRSVPTLIALTVLVAVLYVIMGALDHIRSRLAARMGTTLQSRLNTPVFRSILERSIAPSERSRSSTALKDVESLQRFMSSPVVFGLCDIPWAFLFIFVIYSFHSGLGHLAVVGGVILILLTFLNLYATRRAEAEATGNSYESDAFIEEARQRGEVIKALGMRDAILNRWLSLEQRKLDAQVRLGDRVGLFSAFTKTFRYFLQSAVLGLGAYFVIHGEMTGGAMIAGSILLGRALAPIEQTIAGWPIAQRARVGRQRLKELLKSAPSSTACTELPRPKKVLKVENLYLSPPGTRVIVLNNISFELEFGCALVVKGSSGSGKSTLARALTSVWGASSGSVRLDGATLSQYGDDLGGHIGYLPQDVVLFKGTLAQNIARMQVPDDAAVVAAAKLAGVHDMIVELPQGYDTLVTADGTPLSGGQRQRIGLARAFYGDPVLLVLDEPTSNLDKDGIGAFNAAIVRAKEAGMAVVIMTHHYDAVRELCDFVLMMGPNGKYAFGPRGVYEEQKVRHLQTKIT